MTYRDLLKTLVNLEEFQLDSKLSVYDEFLDTHYTIVEFRADGLPIIAFLDDDEVINESERLPRERGTHEFF